MSHVSALIDQVVEGADPAEAVGRAVTEQGKWIAGAIKKPGALRRELDAKTTKGPRGGDVETPIPAKKLTTTISKLQKKAAGKEKTLPKGELKTLQRAVLARTLRKLGKK